MLKDIQRMMESFSLLSGLKIALIDSHNQGLAVCGHKAGAYCDMIHRSQEKLSLCVSSNKEAFEYALKTKQAHIYRCPFGLVEMVVPIKENETVIGHLIAGPILEEDQQSFYQSAKRRELIPDTADAEQAVLELRHCSKEELGAYRDMLTLLAEYIGGTGQLRLHEKTVGQTVKDYVKRNLSRKITLHDLSLICHCSTVTVTECFRREFGMSVMQYVAKKRMELAGRLLNESRLSVGEISARCGFCDVEYFSRCFNKFFGVCPSEYRKRNKIINAKQPRTSK